MSTSEPLPADDEPLAADDEPRLRFTNETVRNLPIDLETRQEPRVVENACFSRAAPAPLADPEMVAVSASALRLIDLDLPGTDAGKLVAWFSGNVPLPGAEPHAHCYAGHQYGYFNGQLGDGANLYYGDIVNRRGERWQLQLKGTGPTPYARAGMDGRKVLRSSLRELLCSEAMHFLEVPTTRAGCCVVGSTQVLRDKNYDGKVIAERAALVCRLAPTLLRIGSLEICKPRDSLTHRAGPSAGNTDILKQILDFTVQMYYPHILSEATDGESKYLTFFEELVRRTAHLVAQWQCLGFCHGVLNTDNISLVGLTLDYGPFSFMETYDPDHIANASDHWAVFRYQKQPEKCKWCLSKMAEVLELILPAEKLKPILDLFDGEFDAHFLKIMRKKLGLYESREEDGSLVEQLLDTMRRTGADFHKTFRQLTSPRGEKAIQGILANCCSLQTLKYIYRKREYSTEKEIVRSLWALQSNPHLVPQAVSDSRAAVDQLNNRPIVAEVECITPEEKKKKDYDLWKTWLWKYEKRLQLEADDSVSSQRGAKMDRENPRFVLTTALLEEAIRSAESGDYQPTQTLLHMCETPFAADFAHLGDVAQRFLAMYDEAACDSSRLPSRIT